MLDGRDLAATPPYRRPVNMMFQNYALFPHLSVARNVAFGLRQDGLGRAAIAARVKEMLALVKLDGLGGRRPTSSRAANASAWRSRVRSQKTQSAPAR